MKRCLVTGGCGFIGSNLTIELVKRGWKVDVVDDMSNGHIESLSGLNIRCLPNGSFMPEFEKVEMEKRSDGTVLIIQDDFSNINVLNKIESGCYDVVFHQAAIPRVSYSVENPGETTDSNISSTVRLLEACRGNVKRVVFASSSSVYGGADILPTSEDHAKDPKSPYAWQKSSIEELAEMFYNLYDLDIACLRYFNVFGPGQYGDSPYSTAVSAWCHGLKNGSPLRSDGTGEQSRDMCYVENVVQANMLAAESNMVFKGRCYNVACGDRVTNNEILEYLTRRFSSAVIENAPWRPGDVMHTQADITRASEELGYKPSVRFWEGLELTLQWWGLQ
tara:strand:+ start:6661 stop:7662 length:1002 start_codon:yes stop_codon:yes gene_type:complete